MAASHPAEATATRIPGSVLIVDDEPEIVAALREIVAPLVERVDFAETGAEALRRIEAFRYDLLLTDMRMPELDGRGLHAKLRGLVGGAPARVVFMTGDALDGDLRQFIRDSAISVLEKPFTPQEVRRIVAAAFEPPSDGQDGA